MLIPFSELRIFDCLIIFVAMRSAPKTAHRSGLTVFSSQTATADRLRCRLGIWLLFAALHKNCQRTEFFLYSPDSTYSPKRTKEPTIMGVSTKIKTIA